MSILPQQTMHRTSQAHPHKPATTTPGRWSPVDETYLRHSWGLLTDKAIAQHLGRDITSIKNKAKRMMLSKTTQASAQPAAKSKHLQRGRPAPLRANGLHDIVMANTSATGKVLLSPVPSQSELLARRKSERLELASSTMPIRNSTVKADKPYTCPELGRNPGIADSRFEAFAKPSRVGKRLHYPDGRVEVVA